MVAPRRRALFFWPQSAGANGGRSHVQRGAELAPGQLVLRPSERAEVRLVNHESQVGRSASGCASTKRWCRSTPTRRRLPASPPTAAWYISGCAAAGACSR